MAADMPSGSGASGADCRRVVGWVVDIRRLRQSAGGIAVHFWESTFRTDAGMESGRCRCIRGGNLSAEMNAARWKRRYVCEC